ncbi:peptidyl-prolyl cis-trans isomerase [Caulobacter sp. KR2-114]|uniref:peptidylprolyl isomerase n=1 Tax=Caulobacter sp. KR2-114 TaxID=3400912 RepID=UPI003C0A26F7
MTGSIRPTARNPIAVAMMGILTLVFLIIGVSGGGGGLPNAFRSIDANAVIVAGSHTVSQAEFKRIFEQRKQQIDQQQGQPVPLDLLVENGIDQQIVDTLAAERSELEMLSRAGIRPSNSMIDAFLKRQPRFQNPVTGAFDASAYTGWLQSEGLTAREVQEEVRDELADEQFGLGLRYGFHAPRIYTAVAVAQAFANRDVSFFVLDQHAVAPVPPPTDAQLVAYMKAHATDFTLPEMRTFTLVRFSAKEQQASVTVDDAALQREYNFKKDSLSKPETRSLVQIPVKSAAQGADVAARLGKGEDPASVAKAIGAQPIDYADKPKSAVVDAKIAAAAFGMSVGQVQVVQGDLGLGVVKVSKITPGQVMTFEQARPQLEQAIRERGARAKVGAMTDKFDEARDGGASLTDAAQKAGATVVSIGPVTAQGQDLTGKPVAGLDPKILKSAFAEALGGPGTDTQAISSGESFALRVDKISPPALPPVDQNRDALARRYTAETLFNELKAKADALMAQIRKGGSLEAAAAQVNGHVTHQVGLQRVTAQQQVQTLGQPFLQAIFGVKPGEVFDALGPTGLYIARLDAVRAGDTTQMARAVQSYGPRVSEAYAGDIYQAAQGASQHMVKPRTNINAARTAIGVSAETLAKLKAQAAKPGKATTPAKPAS